MQAILSATYIASYRLAMIVSGAGALYLASYLGSTREAYLYSAWKWTYVAMALTMLVGLGATLFSPEPQVKERKETEYSARDYGRFFLLFLLVVAIFISFFFVTKDISAVVSTSLKEVFGSSLGRFITDSTRLLLAIAVAILGAIGLQKLNVADRAMVQKTYFDPVQDFFRRYGSSALVLLLLIGLYRISDIVLGVISGVFYLDIHFTKDEIATAVKTVGVLMSIVGGFAGGFFTVRLGVMKMMFVGALLSSATNLLFLLLAQVGNNIPIFYAVVSADNFVAGMASATFVAFLSNLTNIQFTAVQYAIFTSLMTLFPKVLGGYSGTIVDSVGYPNFFIFTTVIGIPVLYLILLAQKRTVLEDEIWGSMMSCVAERLKRKCLRR